MSALIRSILLCAVVICSVSCGGHKSLKMDYFSGEFVYFADAANFYDCATGVRFPVSQSDGYVTVERRYLSMNPTEAERIPIEFRGHIELLPHMEGDGTIATMVIDTLIALGRTGMCNPNQGISGRYESSDSTRVETLKLSPNYTFTRTKFLNKHDEVTITGVWGLSSALELLLKPLSMTQARSNDNNEDSTVTSLVPSATTTSSVDADKSSDGKVFDTSEELRVESFQVIPDQEALVANGGGGILGFRRVYMK